MVLTAKSSHNLDQGILQQLCKLQGRALRLQLVDLPSLHRAVVDGQEGIPAEVLGIQKEKFAVEIDVPPPNAGKQKINRHQGKQQRASKELAGRNHPPCSLGQSGLDPNSWAGKEQLARSNGAHSKSSV